MVRGCDVFRNRLEFLRRGLLKTEFGERLLPFGSEYFVFPPAV
jgi:hypothetical protein